MIYKQTKRSVTVAFAFNIWKVFSCSTPQLSVEKEKQRLQFPHIKTKHSKKKIGTQFKIFQSGVCSITITNGFCILISKITAIFPKFFFGKVWKGGEKQRKEWINLFWECSMIRCFSNHQKDSFLQRPQLSNPLWWIMMDFGLKSNLFETRKWKSEPIERIANDEFVLNASKILFGAPSSKIGSTARIEQNWKDISK